MRGNLRKLLWTFALIFHDASFAQQDLQKIYAEAKQAQEGGDLSTAASKYQEIVNLQPQMAEAYANLGNIYYQQAKMERAAVAYEKAVRLKPDLAGPHFFLGVISFKSREYSAALDHFQHAAELQPGNPLIHSYLGYTFYALRNFHHAASELEKAGELDPSDLDVRYHLSKSYGHLADEAYRVLEKQFGDSVYANLARAHADEIQENWKDAAEQYAIAQRRLPDNARLKFKVDWSTARAGGTSVPDSGVSTDPVVDASLGYRDTKLGGSELKQQIARWKSLVHGFEKEQITDQLAYQIAEGYQVLAYFVALDVVDSDPDSYRAHELKAQLFETSNKDDQAIAEYRTALSQKPELQNIHFAIGSLYWKNHSFDAARAELLEELKLDPNHPQALYELGDMAAESGDTQKAEQYLAAALKIDPSMLEAHLALEKVYTTNGQYGKSLEQLKRAAALVPSDLKLHYRMSIVYRKMGNIPEADRELALFSGDKR